MKDKYNSIRIRNAIKELSEVEEYEKGEGFSNLISKAVEDAGKNRDAVPGSSDWPTKWGDLN